MEDRHRQSVTSGPGLFDVPSIKTARFLAFTEALLQVGHRYGGGVDTDICTGLSPEGDKTQFISREVVGLYESRIHTPFHSNEKTRHPRGFSELILLGTSDIYRLP